MYFDRASIRVRVPKKIKEKEIENMKNRKEYKNYGTFKVTTEGRSIKDLGVHTGYIDEIAFALADKCKAEFLELSICEKAIKIIRESSVNEYDKKTKSE